MKYRMYVDEIGNSGLQTSTDPKHRYLSLTGVIFELGYVDSVVGPELETLKRRFFETHVDDPIVFHRKELVNKKPPFHPLRDPVIEERFNSDLLTILKTLDYTVVTIVIDKLEHMQRYQIWHYDPYHYCQEVLLERYTLWLESKKVKGDVMAESRGGKEDMRLKKAFSRIFEEGTNYVSAEKFGIYLTSKQLKVKPKSLNVPGLQLADIIAHPSFKAVQARHQNQALPQTFGGKIAAILESSKYHRSPGGKISGWGYKWLP